MPDLAVSFVKHHAEHRKALLDELVLGVLQHLVPGAKHVTRNFVAQVCMYVCGATSKRYIDQ